MSCMLRLWALSRPRTAGVAKVAYRDFGASFCASLVGVGATSSIVCSGGVAAGAGLGWAGSGGGGGLSSKYFPSSTSISQSAYQRIQMPLISKAPSTSFMDHLYLARGNRVVRLKVKLLDYTLISRCNLPAVNCLVGMYHGRRGTDVVNCFI